MFRNNIQVNGGRIVAISFARDFGALPVGTVSPYEAYMTEGAKEEVFERVRANEFPDCPTRLGSNFLFPDRETADMANQQWWSGQRILLPARILHAERFGAFDSLKLNAKRDVWVEAARDYWGGSCCPDSFLEVIVEGVVQLYDWESYGHIGPPPLMPQV